MVWLLTGSARTTVLSDASEQSASVDLLRDDARLLLVQLDNVSNEEQQY